MSDDGAALDQPGRLALGRRLIANTLHYSAANIADTAMLRDLRHDADLLPAIQEKLAVVLDGFHRDSNVIYDIQGRNDQGCDLLVRLNTANDCQFIGFQVKSHRELLTEESVAVLIRQHFEATQHYSPLLTYYIILAADLSIKGDQHRVVRAVQQRFSKTKDVRVVIPQYITTFLRLRRTAVDALVTQTMRTGDPVTTSALGDIQRHPLAAAVLLRLLETQLRGVPAVSVDDLVSDPWLQAVAEATPAARLRDTPFERAIDGRFYKEEEYRKFVGLPPPAEPAPNINTGSLKRLGEWQHLDEYLEEISGGLRRHLLLPNVQAGPDSSARLSELLPGALDMLDEELYFRTAERDAMSINLDEHMALVAIASEGIVKHDLEGDDIIEYVVSLLLPDE